MVLFLTGLVLAAIIVPLQAQIETRKIDETKRTLELARQALLAYAARYGHLPCPATAASGGVEPPPPLTDHTTGVCSEWHGFLPAAALDFAPRDADGYALDAWATDANRIRYAVANQTIANVTNPFTRVNGLAAAGTWAVASSSLLHVCGSGSGVNPGIDCGSTISLATNAAAVVWSLGANAASGGTSADESQNPNEKGGSKDRIFVSRVSSAVSGAEYDDLLLWIPVPMLLAQLSAAGYLPPQPPLGMGEAPIENGQLPPPGSCRVWNPTVPPGQQPPPQSCGGLSAPPGYWLIGRPPGNPTRVDVTMSYMNGTSYSYSYTIK